MGSVNEMIVREYFEANGFLVLQPTKYQVAARGKTPLEEIDLLVKNPHAPDLPMLPAYLEWTGEELKQVGCAVVGIRGWHTDRFSPSIIQTSPEIFRFSDTEVISEVQQRLSSTRPIAKILCYPGLPQSKELKVAALESLAAKGINGLLSFRTMLLELSALVETQHNYEKSELMQTLRILKNYNLLKDAQLEFFEGRRRNTRTQDRAH